MQVTFINIIGEVVASLETDDLIDVIYNVENIVSGYFCNYPVMSVFVDLDVSMKYPLDIRKMVESHSLTELVKVNLKKF